MNLKKFLSRDLRKSKARAKGLPILEQKSIGINSTGVEAEGQVSQTTSEGSVSRLAAIWDHVEMPSTREGVLIAVKGWLEGPFSLMLASRLSHLYPDAIIAVAGSSAASMNTYTNGILVPASPQRALDGVLHLAPDRNEKEVRGGYDIVLWAKEAHKPDISLTFRLGSWEVETPNGSFSGEYSEDFWSLSGKSKGTKDILRTDPNQDLLPSGIKELDRLIATFGIPLNYGKGALNAEREVTSASKLSDEELIVVASIQAIYQPSLLTEDSPDSKAQLAGLLREKLSPSEIQKLSQLLLNASPRTDFFDLVRIVKFNLLSAKKVPSLKAEDVKAE